MSKTHRDLSLHLLIGPDGAPQSKDGEISLYVFLTHLYWPTEKIYYVKNTN